MQTYCVTVRTGVRFEPTRMIAVFAATPDDAAQYITENGYGYNAGQPEYPTAVAEVVTMAEYYARLAKKRLTVKPVSGSGK